MRRYLPVAAIVILAVAAGCGESVPRIEITEVTDGGNGTLTIKYNAREFFSSDIDITAHYTTDTVVMGTATSKGGDGTVGITTTDDGTLHTFVWDYKTDLGIGRHRGITFSIVPYGPDGRGRTGVVGPFDVGLPILYTANEGADSVSIVDVGAGQVSSTASVGAAPRAIIALPNESKLYIANSEDDSLSIVDIKEPTMINTLAVGATPVGLAFKPDGSRVYAVNSGDGTVSVVNSSLTTPAVIDTFTVGTSPSGCSLTENGDVLFVVNSGDDTVSVLLSADGTELVSPVAVGANPQGIATGSRYTVVCNYDDGTVSVLDNADIGPVPPDVAVDSEPVAVAIDATGAFAYVANHGSESISIVNLDLLTVIGTIDLGTTGAKGPRALTFDTYGTTLYVAYGTASQIAKIDVESLSVLTTFSVGANPAGVVILSE